MENRPQTTNEPYIAYYYNTEPDKPAIIITNNSFYTELNNV